MNTYELLLFSIMMVVVGFINGYFLSALSGKEPVLFPDHSVGMASGLFTTSLIVFSLYDKYKSIS